MKTQKIELKKATEIFKDEYTKVNLKDFIVIAFDNKDKLSVKEFRKLMKLYDLSKTKRYEGNRTFMVKRTMDMIELIRL